MSPFGLPPREDEEEEALSELDARTLKDIGFGNHEASSIAAELAGRAERTRIQALRSLREFAL